MTLAKFGVRKLLIFAASLMAMILLAGVLTVSVAQPALAQQEEEGDGGGGWGQRLCDGASLVPAPGTGLICDTGRAAVDRVAGGDEGSGDGSGSSEDNQSGEGSSDGGGNGGGGDWNSSGSGGMSEEASQGRFGPWTGLINLLLGLLTAAGGIGIASGIGLLATAAGRESQIDVGKKVLEGSFGGFLIGTMAIPVYEVVTRVVVGF